MASEKAIADHWGTGDVFELVMGAVKKMGIPQESLTVENLAPVDHFHARGFVATVKLADRLTIQPGQHIIDIGCGLGGPARYLAKRFQCKVSGVDLTFPFVETANKLTRLLRMEDQVVVSHGDGNELPYPDTTFDGAISQHVTMNVSDRGRYFAEAYRVLKPGAFFAVTEHGLGPKGNPQYPLPWSADGSGAFLVTPAESRACLKRAGFTDIAVEDTGPKYVSAYKVAIEKLESGTMPPLGIHILQGRNALDNARNAARNIEEGRTHPIMVICRKPA
jgi:ubiquinone/menaquinone biosynthesis C-methylase UbiE